MDAQSADSNEDNQSLSGAKYENGLRDKTSSSESFNKDSSDPAILKCLIAQVNDTIRTGSKRVPSETESIEFPKTMNVTTVDETTNSNEVKQSLSDGIEENDHYDDMPSYETLKQESGSSVSPVVELDLTTQANGSIETGKTHVPSKTESLQSPKTMNIPIDAETTQHNDGNETPKEENDQCDYSPSCETLKNDSCITEDETANSNEVKQSLSDGIEENDHYDDMPSYETLKQESGSSVSPVVVLDLTTQANGSIETGKTHVPSKTESLQSPKTMNIPIDAETTQHNDGNETPKEENDQCDYSHSETLENDSCSLVIPVMLFGLATHENGSNQTGNKSVLSGNEPLQSQRKMNVNMDAETKYSIDVKVSLLDAKKWNLPQCEDTPSSATLTKYSCNPVSSVMVEGLKTQANESIHIAKSSMPAESEPVQLTRKTNMTTNAETTDSNEPKEPLSDPKEEIDDCDDTSSSDTLNMASCSYANPLMLLSRCTQGNCPIQTGDGRVSPETESMQSLKKTNISTDPKTKNNNEVTKSLSSASTENDEWNGTSSPETLDEGNCSSFNLLMLQGPTSEGSCPIQGGKGHVPLEREAMQSPQETNRSTDFETADNNEVKEPLSGAKEEIYECDDTSSSETLNKDSCTSVTHVMVLGRDTEGNDSVQVGKGSVSPETESMQSLKKTNIITCPKTTNNNEVKESLSSANSENGECDGTSSSETSDEGNCTCISHVMLLGPNSEENGPVQGGKGCVLPEANTIESPKETNIDIDAEATDDNKIKEPLSGAKEEIDECDDTSSSETLNKDSCTSDTYVMLLYPTTEGNCPIQRGKGHVPPETESMQSPKETNITTDAETTDNSVIRELLSSANAENDKCDVASFETLNKDKYHSASPVILLGPTSEGNCPIQARKGRVSPYKGSFETKNINTATESINTNVFNKFLFGGKETNDECEDTPTSETFTNARCNSVSSAMLVGMTTQTNDPIQTCISSVPAETESIQSPKNRNITTNAETTDNDEVKESLLGAKKEIDEGNETTVSETINKDSCTYVTRDMLVGINTEGNCSIQTGNGRVQSVTKSMESLKKTNTVNDAETADNNEIKKSLSAANAKNDKCDDTSSLEILDEDSCISISHVMLLGPNSEGIGHVQGGKGCVLPETEAMQSSSETNRAIDAEKADNNEIKEPLSGAQHEIDECNDTSSSETLKKDSCTFVTPVIQLSPTSEGNDPIQGGKGRVAPETEAMQSLKKTNIATDAETADNNEVKEPLSGAGPTTHANGLNQTGKRSLPPWTKLLPSSKKINIGTDAESTHSNLGNKSLSDVKKEKYQCDETPSSEISKIDSSSPVNPALPDMTTVANDLIQTGKKSVTQEVELLQSPETMNVTIISETKDRNEVYESLSYTKENCNQPNDSPFSGTLNKESCNIVSPVMVQGMTMQVNGSFQRGTKRVPQEIESFESCKKMNIALDAVTVDSNKVNESLLENDSIKGEHNDKRITAEAMQQTQNDKVKSGCYVMDSGSVSTEEQIYATIYGQCIGDAIGLLTEFMSKDEARNCYENSQLEYANKKEDRHRKRWKIGDWTDDSDQMILIMQSLAAEEGVVNPKDFARRLVRWMVEGFQELGDNGGLGIGHTTYITITRKGFEANPYKISKDVWEDSGRFLAPNGGVMRTSILGIHVWWDTNQVYRNAIDICKTTHFDPRCQASAVSVCVAISLMLQRKERHYKNGEYIIQTIIEDVFEEAKTCLKEEEEKEELRRYLQYKDLSELQLDEVSSIGYTYKCLGAGFWALKQCDFRTALQDIAMCGGDADTNGAVAGALLGCKLGSRKCFPDSWLQLKHRDWLDTQIQDYLKVLKKQQEEWNLLKTE